MAYFCSHHKKKSPPEKSFFVKVYLIPPHAFLPSSPDGDNQGSPEKISLPCSLRVIHTKSGSYPHRETVALLVNLCIWLSSCSSIFSHSLLKIHREAECSYTHLSTKLSTELSTFQRVCSWSENSAKRMSFNLTSNFVSKLKNSSVRVSARQKSIF